MKLRRVLELLPVSLGSGSFDFVIQFSGARWENPLQPQLEPQLNLHEPFQSQVRTFLCLRSLDK